MHRDADRKDMITLAAHEICPTAWCTIHGLSRATFYRYKEKSRNDEKAKHHGNFGLKKPQSHTLQATATLRLLFESSADQMPYRSRTLPSGERVPSMILPFAFRWRDALPEINTVNFSFQL